MHRALTREAEMNRMKGNLVSSISHELRAPIASIRLMTQSLRGGRVSSEVKRSEYLDLLLAESRRLGNLVENVLDFLRIDQ